LTSTLDLTGKFVPWKGESCVIVTLPSGLKVVPVFSYEHAIPDTLRRLLVDFTRVVPIRSQAQFFEAVAGAAQAQGYELSVAVDLEVTSGAPGSPGHFSVRYQEVDIPDAALVVDKATVRRVGTLLEGARDALYEAASALPPGRTRRELAELAEKVAAQVSAVTTWRCTDCDHE
jgi:hypothetical protein